MKTLFIDEFEGPAGAAPSSVWSRYPHAQPGTYSDPAAPRLDGQGNLDLVLNGPNSSAGIWTEGKLMVAPPFTAEITLRFPDVYNVWSGFWWEGGPYSSKGELDICENGGRRDVYQVVTHEWAQGKEIPTRPKQNIQFPTGAWPSQQFHTYGAQVSELGVQFTYDGAGVGAVVPLTAAFNNAGSFRLTHWPATSVPTADHRGYPAILKVARFEVTTP
jgi:beta-glucanase (GH16 family)